MGEERSLEELGLERKAWDVCFLSLICEHVVEEKGAPIRRNGVRLRITGGVRDEYVFVLKQNPHTGKTVKLPD